MPSRFLSFPVKLIYTSNIKQTILLGEISCSVEETNRIRAMLGMKPLNVETKMNEERVAVDNFRNKAEKEKKSREAEELRLKLEKAKEKRVDKERLAGAGLSEIGKEAEDTSLLSAADWVKRSR